MKKFDKIWAKSEEKLCKAVVLYPGTDSVLYRDAHTGDKAVTKDDLVDLFKKGLVVVDAGEDGVFRPTTLEIDEDVATVTVDANTWGSAGYEPEQADA